MKLKSTHSLIVS